MNNLLKKNEGLVDNSRLLVDNTIYKINKYKYKTLILLDWDDTLFPTSWVVKKNIDLTDPETQNKYIVFFAKLDLLLHKLLSNMLQYGKVIIVTNAVAKWVFISSIIIPNTHLLLKNRITVVSARDIYQNAYRNDGYMWKKLVFKQIATEYYNNNNNVNNINNNSIENIISIGDAEYEFKALLNLNNINIKKRHLKAIRFMTKPSYDILIDQLEVLNKSVSKIMNTNNNMDLLFDNI